MSLRNVIIIVVTVIITNVFSRKTQCSRTHRTCPTASSRGSFAKVSIQTRDHNHNLPLLFDFYALKPEFQLPLIRQSLPIFSALIKIPLSATYFVCLTF